MLNNLTHHFNRLPSMNRIFTLLLIAVFVFGGTLKAQTGLPVVAQHPRLMVNSAIKTALLAKAAANHPDYVAMLAEANTYATKPVLPFTQTNIHVWNTNYIFYSYYGSSWQDAAMPLAFAHLVAKGNNTGSFPTAYSNKLIELADVIIAAQADPNNNCAGCYNPIQGNGHYASRHVGLVIGIIFDFCYDELGATRRAQLVDVMNQWFDNIRQNGYQKNDRSTGNYFWGHAFAAACMGYASFGDNPAAQTMIDWARMRFDGTPSALVTSGYIPNDYLSQTFEGGYEPYAGMGWLSTPMSGNPQLGGQQIQGWAYGSHNWMRVMDYMLIVKTATTEDLPAARQNWLVQMMYATKHALLPNRYEIDHYSDWGGNFGNLVPHSFPIRLAYLLANTPYGANAQHLAQTDILPYVMWGWIVWDPEKWEKFYYNDNTRPQTPITAPPYYSGFSDGYAQWAGNGAWPYFIMRKNWDTTATWAGYHAGNFQYDDHQHFDAGSIELKKGSYYLLTDAGSWKDGDPNGFTGNNTLAENSGSKNTLFFNDYGDYMPIDYRTVGGQFYYGKDQVAANEQNNTFTRIRSNCTSAYNRNVNQADTVNRKLDFFYRDFLYLRDADIFVMYDKVKNKSRASGPAYEKHLRWHFPANAPAVNGNSITAVHGNAKLYIHTLLPAANLNINVVNEINNPDNTIGSWINYYYNSETWRAEVKDATNPLQYDFLSVLQPGNLSTAEMVSANTASNDGLLTGCQITLPSGAVEVVFFNNQAVPLPAPVTNTNYNFSGNINAWHTICGVVPNAAYQVSYSGGVVSVVQNASGNVTASLSGVIRFNLSNLLTCATPNAVITPIGPTVFCEDGSVRLEATDLMGIPGITYQWYQNGAPINGATEVLYTAETSGNYTVLITAPGGCSDESTSISITVHASPAVNLSPVGSANICNTQTLLLTAQSNTATAYQWLLNGNNIAGATQSTYNATGSGSYSVQVTDANGCAAVSQTADVTYTPYCPLLVKAKIWLEGAYMVIGQMSAQLSTGNLIPLAQPYNAAPWYYFGSETLSAVPADMTDWILLELLDADNNMAVAGRRAALLKTDGSVWDTDGTQGVKFNNLPNGIYYLAVRHRNHLAVISSMPADVSGAVVYNFTQSAAQALGPEQLKPVGNGAFALYAGDINANGIINYTDFNLYMPQASLTNVYAPADVNMDKVVNTFDFDFFRPNISRLGMSLVRY